MGFYLPRSALPEAAANRIPELVMDWMARSSGRILWEREEGRFSVASEARFEVETTTGDSLAFAEVQALDHASRLTRLSDFVHLSAWTTPVSITAWDPDGGAWLKVIADAEGNCKAHFRLMPDTMERIPEDGLMVHLVVLNGKRQTALIIAKMNGIWERVGYYGALWDMTLYDSNGMKVGEDCGSKLKKYWRKIRLG